MAEPSPNPVWAEVVQLVPVITLASSFLVAGEVDLDRAGPLFGVAAVLSVGVGALVWSRGHAQNPILVGVAAWLWVGAIAFLAPVPSLAAWLTELQGAALFGAALLVGAIATFTSTRGYIGARHPDPTWVRKTSWALLGLTVAALGWALVFRADLRLGGGVPFVVLNVARRVIIARWR